MTVPPQRPDFMNISTQPRVTFEELDEALRPLKDARSAAYAIGLIYGGVCAPYMVKPSQYLPLILGQKMELPDAPTAERVLSLLYSLHNQMAEMVEDDLPLSMRQKVYEPDKGGLLQHATELWQEVEGFRGGLSLGMETKDDLPRESSRAYVHLAMEQNFLKSIMRSIRAKRKPQTAQDTEQRQQDLFELGARTGLAMQTIAHILYVQRMARLKPVAPFRVGRNDPCPCGSGKKFKHCCMDKIRPTNVENN